MRYYLDYNASAPILKDVKDYIISTLDIGNLHLYIMQEEKLKKL